MQKIFESRLLRIAGMSGILLFCFAPSTAEAGLFNFLFGPGPAQTQTQVRETVTPDHHHAGPQRRHFARAHHALRQRKKIVAKRHMRKFVALASSGGSSHGSSLAYATSGTQPASDQTDSAVNAIDQITHDATLRPGDALMTPTGLKVYEGPSTDSERQPALVNVKEARSISAHRRARLLALVALKMTASGGKSRVAASPRQAIFQAEIFQDERLQTQRTTPLLLHPAVYVVDARGRKLRFVGGYYNPS